MQIRCKILYIESRWIESIKVVYQTCWLETWWVLLIESSFNSSAICTAICGFVVCSPQKGLLIESQIDEPMIWKFNVHFVYLNSWIRKIGLDFKKKFGEKKSIKKKF